MTFQWTQDIEDEIFARLIDGESIVDICGDDREKTMPSQRTFYRRLSDDTDFWQRYARAREAQAHREAEEIRTIADMATPEDYNVARLRIDARKWRAAKLAPKAYGDRVITQGDKDADPIQVEDVSAVELIKARLDAIAGRTTGEASEG